jgi:hypothetical protein
MGQKVTALHIDARGYVVKVRALSKSRRGSSFTLRAGTAERMGPGRTNLRAAVQVAIERALKADE